MTHIRRVRGIIHLIAPARFGGLERVVETLARGQMEAGLSVMVAAIVDDDTTDPPALEKLKESGVDTVSFPIGARRYLDERRRVGELLRARQPEILHTHGYRPDVVDAPVARSLGISTVTTVHGFSRIGLRNRIYEWLQKRAFRRFDAVVAVSSQIATEVHHSGVPSGTIHLVKNVWERDPDVLPRPSARALLGLDEADTVIGWVGRFSREKGADLMLRALESMEDSRPILCFVGAGPLESSLRLQAEEAGISDRVRWCGIVSDAHRLMTAFDMLAVTSRTEGTPLVVLEAMASETPVVAHSVGGIPDILDESQGILVPYGTPRGLSDAFMDVISDPAEASARATRARDRLHEEFSVEPWVKRYSEIYELARS